MRSSNLPTLQYALQISVVLNRAMRCLNTDKRLTNKVTIIYKMQNILQLKDLYNLEMSKFMYKYTTSRLPATFNNILNSLQMFISNNTRQVKTRQFALPKARINSGGQKFLRR